MPTSTIARTHMLNAISSAQLSPHPIDAPGSDGSATMEVITGNICAMRPV